MKSSKDFFEELREGEEWISCIMSKETYSGLHHEYKELISIGTVRKNNNALKNDETHKELIRNVSKAKSELIKYEFSINYK